MGKILACPTTEVRPGNQGRRLSRAIVDNQISKSDNRSLGDPFDTLPKRSTRSRVQITTET
jgi:hypothetical protein